MTQPGERSWRSPASQLLVVSGVSWVFEGCCGHQLEFVKIIKQTTRKPYPTILREIIAQKGVGGLWDGFFPWGTVQALSKGAVFGWANALMRKTLSPLSSAGTISMSTQDTLAGAGAGGVQGFVLSPTLLLKTRVMTDPVFRERMGVLETTRRSCQVGARVIGREGVLSLMKGAPTFAIKRVADWGSRYLFVNLVEDFAYRRGDVDRRRKLAYSQQVTASLLGGSLSAMATVPLDVMVAQIQQAAKAGERVTVWGTFKAQWAEGGLERVAGFATRGFVARCTHVALTTVVIKTGTEFVTDVLEGEQRR